VELRHVLRVAPLPFHHRDPFDRLLATQALEEQLAIVSADRVFRKYGATTIW
jgi:PIN domain nuclease of toxin-antitoxin system